MEHLRLLRFKIIMVVLVALRPVDSVLDANLGRVSLAGEASYTRKVGNKFMLVDIQLTFGVEFFLQSQWNIYTVDVISRVFFYFVPFFLSFKNLNS